MKQLSLVKLLMETYKMQNEDNLAIKIITDDLVELLNKDSEKLREHFFRLKDDENELRKEIVKLFDTERERVIHGLLSLVKIASVYKDLYRGGDDQPAFSASLDDINKSVHVSINFISNTLATEDDMIKKGQITGKTNLLERIYKEGKEMEKSYM